VPLKAGQIHRIAQDYREAFPGWRISIDLDLVRAEGPILQGILFDRSSKEDYRPTGYVRTLTTPAPTRVLALFQPLKNRNGSPGRRVSIGSHERELAEIADELRLQIRPLLDQPLDVNEVLALLEAEAIPKAAQAYSLATLHAYLERPKDARSWCARFEKLQGEFTDWGEVETERAAFIKELIGWLDGEEAHKRLEEVIIAERRKLGIA
jgi:hypothetical protein